MITWTSQSDETETAVSVTSQLNTAGASTDATATAPETESIESKPVVTKVNGLTMCRGNVVPKREASRIKGQYMTASKALLRSTRFTAAEKLVIIYLTDMLMEDNDHCWPSHKTIAAQAGLSKRTMITAVNKLVDAGVIIRAPGIGRKHSTRYYLTQSLFPCLIRPETLCDRDTCQERCQWRSINSADLALLTPESTENKQCEIGTLSPLNSAKSAPFMPINSADLAHKEKNNNSNEKEGGGKRSCPPGAAGPAPRPSLSIEMSEVESGSGHSQVKDLFCRLYENAFGKPYVWQGQDGAILKDILQLDIRLDEVKAAVENMFEDKWLVDKGLVNMKMFKSNVNQYLPSTKPQASGQGSWDDTAIEVHTRPQPGEEPYPWLWPRTCQPRIDHDIPRKNQNRSMDEFSSGLVGRAHEWLRNEDRSQGWVLTLTGTFGNGKSSFAGALLQAWRDHMTPELDSLDLDPDIPDGKLDTRSQFITFESFKADSYVTDSNPNTGWTGQSRINDDYISNLAKIQFLVLDDLCSHDMEKVQYDALHSLLRLREQRGHMTVITTNKTIAEIAELLGENVADRLRAGVILKFVDDSQRGDQVIRPRGLERAADGIRMMPNPEMDPDKVNIPYVEPKAEECSDMSIADQMRAEARAASAKSLPSINPDELNAALATIEPTTAAAEPVTPNLGALTPSRPPSGSCEE